MEIRKGDPVKELKIHATALPSRDSAQRVVKLERTVDRRTRKMQRRLDTDRHHDQREDDEQNAPNDEGQRLSRYVMGRSQALGRIRRYGRVQFQGAVLRRNGEGAMT